MTTTAAFNRELGLRINQEVWNDGDLDKVELYFTRDFVADRTPYGVIRGLDALKESVRRSHAAFGGFAEEVRTVVADESHVVIHFTIKGRHTGPWGRLRPRGARWRSTRSSSCGFATARSAP